MTLPAARLPLLLAVLWCLSPAPALGQPTAPARAESAPVDRGSLHDITGVEQVPPAPDSRPSLLPWVGPALVLLALLLWVGWRWRRRPAPKEPLADRWALAELDRLAGEEVASPDGAEQFATRLSDVLRRYLELRFQIRAPRQTTAEFLEGVRGSPLLTAAQRDALGELLGRCDLAKFARAGLSPEERLDMARSARELVEQTAAPARPPGMPAARQVV